MYPHRIRLRGPWECEPLSRQGDERDRPLPAPFRMTLPCRWGEAGLPDFSGRVRFRRRFGYPGRIDAHERVWLTFAGIAGTADIRLNDHLLGRHEDPTDLEFDVTGLLRPRNDLVVEIDGGAGQGGLWGEVALVVRCTAFLRDVSRFAMLTRGRVQLRVSGRVVGTADRPLEIYAVLGRSVVAYQVMNAAPDGESFEMVIDDLPADEWRDGDGHPRSAVVKVDLVNGATVWYTDEAEVPLASETKEGG